MMCLKKVASCQPTISGAQGEDQRRGETGELDKQNRL